MEEKPGKFWATSTFEGTREGFTKPKTNHNFSAGSVSKKECIKKLRRAAMSLKKPFLQKVVGDLPRRINNVVQAKGSYTGKD